METVSPEAASTGDAEQKVARTMRAEKPMMIYVTPDDPTDKTVRKLDAVVFPSEKLGVGAKFFETIKISAAHASQDRMLRKIGKSTPRIIFMSRDYKVMKVLEKKSLSAGKITTAMKNAAKAEYVNNFNKMVSGYIKLLNQLDRLEARKTQLADTRTRLVTKPNAGKQKKLERKEAEYLKDRDAWFASEKALLTFRRKGDPKPEA